VVADARDIEFSASSRLGWTLETRPGNFVIIPVKRQDFEDLELLVLLSRGIGKSLFYLRAAITVKKNIPNSPVPALPANFPSSVLSSAVDLFRGHS